METQVQSLGREDPLGQEMATHASILAWKISWTEEPGGLRLQQVEPDCLYIDPAFRSLSHNNMPIFPFAPHVQ